MQAFFKLTFSLVMLISLSGGIIAQTNNGKLYGRISTSDGKPAAAVSVRLKESTKGTTSDEKGEFEIHSIQAGKHVLLISLLGSKPQEKTVAIDAGKTAFLNVQLSENSSQLREVIVTGTNLVNRPVALGKASIRPLDLPQSTGVISNAVIADQQALRLGDVLKNVSGVSLTQTRQGVAETFSARGYSIGIAGSGGSIFKNGVISNTQGFPEASTLESIEVLKGSSALLYGNVSGGLIINMVTKKPQFDWGGQVSMMAGSYDLYKPTADIYGPITKNLAFRVIGTHEKANSYRDVVNTSRTYVNPSLLFKPGKRTDILLEMDYLQSDLVPDAGIGVPNDKTDVVIPYSGTRSRFINSSWAYNRTNQASGFLTINHQLNDTWKLTAIGSVQGTRVKSLALGVPMAVKANGDWNRSLSAVKSAEDDYTGQVNLNGSFKTGAVGHQLLVGTDFTRIVTQAGTFKFVDASGKTGTAYDIINIFDPSKYAARTDIPAANDTAVTTTPQNRFGVYFQDLISLSSNFKVLAGLRWTYQKAFQSTIFNKTTQVESGGAAADKEDKAFSPKVALIYKPGSSNSLYIAYANNFTTNTGTDVNDNALEPSIIDQYEAGMKNEFLNGKLSANISVYRIVNSNFAQTALFYKGAPNTNSSIKELSGETTSDGLEVDLNGAFSKNVYFIAGYGYNYMRYTNTTGKPGSQVEGERLINNPSHTANASVFYTFDKSSLKGLKLGVSAFYTGKRFGGLNNTVGLSYNNLVPLKAFTTVDLSAGYTYHNVSLLAKVSNITNELNYVVHDRYSINPIAPRQLMATLSYKF